MATSFPEFFSLQLNILNGMKQLFTFTVIVKKLSKRLPSAMLLPHLITHAFGLGVNVSGIRKEKMF